MRYILTVAILIFCFVACHLPNPQGQEVEHPYDWLVGNWERTGLAPGKTAFERWTMNADVDLIGKGISLSGSDTSFVEDLKIINSKGDYYYVADVSQNPQPVQFKIEKINDYSFRASNPAHDFPKFIEYILNGEELTVHISDDSLRRSFTFQKYKRMVQ